MRPSQIFKIALCMMIFATSVSAQWQSTGPDGGRLSTLWIDRLNSNRLLVGSGSNGLFESNDGGMSFQPVDGTPVTSDNPLRALGVRQLTGSPNNPQSLLMTTGITPPFGGVYRSTDSGASWHPVNQGLPQGAISLSSLAYSHDGLAVYAAASTGIHVSFDHESWSFLANPSAFSGPRTVATSPTNAERLYVTTFNYELFRSDDSGSSWLQIGDSFENYAFAVDQDPGERLIRSSSLGSIDISDDLGSTWTNVTTELFDSAGLARIISLHPVPSSDRAFALSTHGLFESLDNGAHWLPINRPQQAPTQFGADRFVVGPNNTLYLLSDVGLFTTSNGGESWHAKNAGIRAHVFSDLEISPADGSWVTRAFSAFRSSDQGQSWSDIGIKVEPATTTRAIGLSSMNPTRMYAATNKTLAGSNDTGQTWQSLGDPAEDGDGVALSWVDPTDDSNIVVAIVEADFATQFGGLFRSVDGGMSWTQVFASPPDRLTFIPESVAYDPTSPGTVYFGVHTQTAELNNEGLLLRSTDHGNTFEIVLDGMGAPSVVVDAGGNVYAAGSEGSTNKGVWRSSDGGNTWTPQNSGLPMPFSTADLATHPSDPGHILVTNSDDIFESTDGGGFWHAVERSPGASRINALAVVPDSDSGYAILAAGAGNIYVGQNVSQNEPLAVPASGKAAQVVLILSLVLAGIMYPLMVRLRPPNP